jgi:hypothetical protein
MTLKFAEKRLHDQFVYFDKVARYSRHEVFISAYEMLVYWRKKVKQLKHES